MKMRRLSMVAAAGLAALLSVPAGADIGFNTNGFGPGGINVDGSYRGAKWTVNYNFGGGWGGPGHGGHGGHGHHGGGWSGWSGWGGGWGGGGWYVGSWNSPYGWGWYWDRYRPYGYASGPIESRSGPVDWSLLPGVNPQNPDASAAELPKAPLTKVELAREAAGAKKHEDAAALYREHLKTAPEDVESMRQLAVCLIEGKEVGAGLAMLRDLYTKDPTLADRPFDGAAMGLDGGRLREVIVKVSPIANKVKSPSAWLAVVVMMQAEGRKVEALRAVQKAKDAGLERAVVDRFLAALTPPPPAPKAAPAAKPVKPAAVKGAAPVKAKKPAGPPKPGPVTEEPGSVPADQLPESEVPAGGAGSK